MGHHALFARGFEGLAPLRNAIVVDGIVVEVLANGLFRVTLDTGHEVVAHLSGAQRLQVIRVLPGDRVQIELSPIDHSRGQNRWLTKRPGH